jgi:DNA repair exonuclease SbcCD ATPase subunit
MILFKKIRFKNFGSFGNTWTEIQLDTNNTTIVCGVNGSGKSFALLDSITFALFGKPFRKINLTQIANSINKKNCLVELEFSISKDEYKIIRGLSPKIFEIYKNGKLVNQDPKNIDYQQVLEQQITKMNYKTFTQVVILGSSSFVPFMQLTAADRRIVIENILDINVFTTMNTILKGKISITKDNLTDISSKIELQDQKVQYQNKIVDSLAMRLNNDMKKIADEIKNHQSEINKHIDEISILEKSKEQYKTDSDLDELEEKSNETTQKISNILYKIGDLQKEIKFYSKTDTCPKCKTTLTDEMKNKNIDSIQKEIDKHEKNANDMGSVNQEEKSKIKVIKDNLKKIESINSEIKELNSTIREINSLIHYKKSQLVESGKVESDLLREKQILKLEKDALGKLTNEKIELKKDFDYLKIAGDLLKDNGVKIKIIKHYLPAMNKFINKYLRAMDFFVQFHIDEEFNEIIKSRHRDEFSYMNFSEGEKMRIDLALLLSWREIAKLKNSINCNLLILDEIFDSSLDSVGIDEVLKLLNALGSKTNVFVISHKADQIIDKFSNTIMFEKKNNFSKMMIA